MGSKTAIIIGAGPAGLTAACELIETTSIRPVIYEASGSIGGICRTESYKGNKIDIGGHRFFSRYPQITAWWLKFLPLQAMATAKISSRKWPALIPAPLANAPDPETEDRVMLMRQRRSRILFNNKLFDYPIKLNARLLTGFGIGAGFSVLASYIKSKIRPIRDEQSLEDFLINRFGRRLYNLFFKDYTEKVWGAACDEIPADWGRQRIKGISITKTLSHAIKQQFFKSMATDTSTESSLIDQFLYPKFGPGQLWEAVAEKIKAGGGEIFLNHRVTGITHDGAAISAVKVENTATHQTEYIKGDYFISTMPVKDLLAAFESPVPPDVRKTAGDLQYRDLIIVGLLFSRAKLQEKAKRSVVPDCWLYVQEKGTRIGRIQIINNWNPYMVADKDTIWMAAEICCSHEDALWRTADPDIIAAAVQEMTQIGLAAPEALQDGVVLRQPKAYPAYTGGYSRFEVIKNFTDSFGNLFLVGRNGMHQYNNMDHSMLTAFKAVECIRTGEKRKAAIWAVNAEYDYQEIK